MGAMGGRNTGNPGWRGETVSDGEQRGNGAELMAGEARSVRDGPLMECDGEAGKARRRLQRHGVVLKDEVLQAWW